MALYDIIATAYVVVGIALAIYLVVAHIKKRYSPKNSGKPN
jgi:hypothetical protein